MVALFWIVVIALVLAGIVYLRQQAKQSARRPQKQSQPAAAIARTLFNLQIGDIVQYAGTDWAVEDRLLYDDGGYTWLEYLLQDGDRIAWLAVDEDDRLIVSLSEPTDALQLEADPPQDLTVAEETYRCVESGWASVSYTAPRNLAKAENRCRYWDYEGSDNKVLAIEKWRQTWEVSLGYRIAPRALNLLPGDGKSIYQFMEDSAAES